MCIRDLLNKREIVGEIKFKFKGGVIWYKFYIGIYKVSFNSGIIFVFRFFEYVVIL